MDKLFFALVFVLFTSHSISQIQEIRQLYVKAVEDKAVVELLLEKFEKLESSDLKLGYTGAVKMLMAKHVFSPFKKLSYFNEGKKMLDQSIINNPNNPELRYLRYGIQKHTPRFLNYNKNLEEDKKFLESPEQLVNADSDLLIRIVELLNEDL